ncbi:MAG TPA: DoxX family protein [Gemmatimonadaceae bacterium]|nr:DoxX family protein [Gemmatimonadaceae bacterium]
MTAATHPRIDATDAAVWAGRIVSALVALFMTMDAVTHLLKPQPVVTAFGQLGLPLELSVPIGLLALACTALYLIPRTSLLGAVLLTGYLGGAVAIQARAASATFPTIFPVVVGVLAWGGLALRGRVRV